MLVEGFDEICAACHVDQIRGVGQVGAKGISFLTVPGLDLIELRARDAAIGEWPEWSEERMTPFMRAMLADEEGFQQDMQRLEALDLLDLTDSSDEDIAAIERMVWRIKGLVYRLIESGTVGMAAPLSQALGRTLDRDELARLFGVIPADVIRSAQAVWFPNLVGELARHERGERVSIPGGEAPAADQKMTAEQDASAGPEASDGSDILSGIAQDILSETEGEILSDSTDDILSDGKEDILSAGEREILPESDILVEEGDEDIVAQGQTDILSAGEESILGETDITPEDVELSTAASEAQAEMEAEVLPEVDPEVWADLGGWYRGDLALYYKPVGHADQFVKAWLQFGGATQGSPDRPAARAVFAVLSDVGAPGRCAKCHSSDQHAAGAMEVNWSGERPRPGIKTISKFSHISHFSLLDEKGCRTCHRINWGAKYAEGFKDHDPFVFSSNFTSIGIESCAGCHVEDKAGEACLICHQYHVGAFATRSVPTAMK